MSGLACLRIFPLHRSHSPSAPQYAPSNSLFRNILTPKPFVISDYAQIPRNQLKTRFFGGGGEGVLRSEFSPK